ncbi:hypothetical protein [Streptomyces sp. NBC_00207]
MLYGRTGDKLADHPDNDELYAMAERLAVPLTPGGALTPPQGGNPT